MFDETDNLLNIAFIVSQSEPGTFLRDLGLLKKSKMQLSIPLTIPVQSKFKMAMHKVFSRVGLTNIVALLLRVNYPRPR